jgi:hypothetical protein
MITTFGKPRFEKDHEYELLRSCSKLNISVIGGFDKLINHFVKTISSSIISYVDNDYFNGSGYKKWILLRETSPGYFWTNSKDIVSRFKTQKKQLAKWLPNFDPSESETVNMRTAGFNKFYNSGNLVYSYEQIKRGPKSP